MHIRKAPVVAANPFESGSTLSLIARFAIPCVVSLLVAAIYNIVDQIFIGQIVGYLGNAATNVMFPLVTLSTAIGALVGDGTAANLSLHLGAGEEKTAARVFGSGFCCVMVLSLVYTVLCALFLDPLLSMLGTTEGVRPYALEYTSIVLLSFPFSMISSVLNSAIRADGNPRYAMIATLIGVGLNIVLDAWFMCGLGWGIRGAAFATLVGQAVSWVASVRYLKCFRQFRPERQFMRLNIKLVRESLALGTPSFITEVSGACVQILVNNLILIYGAASVYGADIPLAAFGVVMKINMILISVLLGVAVGAQPLLGYKYGAKRFGEVRRLYRDTVVVTTAIAVAGWVALEGWPAAILGIFGQESDLYMIFAVKCLRMFEFGVFCGGFQITTSVLFQAIGKPGQAVLLTLGRRILLQVPLTLVMGASYGLDGILYANPVADTAATILTATLAILELRRLKSAETHETDLEARQIGTERMSGHAGMPQGSGQQA